MVTSTSSMNVPRQTAISGIHLRIGGLLSAAPAQFRLDPALSLTLALRRRP
jgi:hypothetical protein